MTPFGESSNFDAQVNSYDTTDPVQGGSSGVANNPLQSLVNRTRWLYNSVQSILQSIGQLAPLNSPPFTGSPTTPTPPFGDTSSKVANMAALAAALSSVAGGSGGSGTPTSSGSAGSGWRYDPRDGWLEQWGEADSAITSEGTYVIQFPELFTTCLGVLGQAIDPGSATDSTHMQRGTYTTGAATFRAQDGTGGNAASAAGIAWRAWGFSSASPSPNPEYGSGATAGSVSGGSGQGTGGHVAQQ